MHRGLVLKKQANLFTIKLENGQIFDCVARKTLKKDGVFVGDYVVLDDALAVSKIEKRKNILIRPPVANIDKMFIVVAPIPKPDLYTIDKLVLFCVLNSIKPVICVNKSDLDLKCCEDIKKIYKDILPVLIFSSLDETVLKLKNEIKGICVLAGQSAVGKSSIINALKKESVCEVGDFSKKIERGKQTTRTVQLFDFGDNNYLADTAGFSKLDESLLDLKDNEIKNYYPEFLKYASECKYKSCAHTGRKDCKVFEAVQSGKISRERYENYLKLYNIIKSIKKY